MYRLVASLAVAATLTAAAPVPSGADPATPPSGADDFIIQAKDHADLNQKYCAANPNMEHVLVLPA
jgi:hypothetical protein